MSDIIKLLPDSIANQIAAGEVVQRPASAVKELLENSIDAGSTRIQLIIRDAGKQLIQVIDNGKGMSATDARMSFERHATSKITSADDLFKLKTYGFRGEALASIAAVAQVELKTRQANEEIGTLLRVEGSEVKTQEPVATEPGTSISVKNLFYNVPARRNFLKSNPVELKHIIDEFQRVALAYPEISFQLFQNDLETYNLPAEKLSKRIVDIFGRSYQEQLIRVEEDTDFLKIEGYIGKPENSRKTRGEQFFFVNNRFIKSNYLHHAVMYAFDELLSDEYFPFYVLFIEIDPKHVDVNVHPTKTEIKFDDEKTIYAIMRAAMKKALATHNITPSIDFDNNINYDFFPQSVSTPEPARQTFPSRATGTDRLNQNNWQDLYRDFENKENIDKLRQNVDQQNTITLSSSINRPDTAPTEEGKLDRNLLYGENNTTFQLHNRYIVTQVKSGMMVIDQQSAHERILYEKYLGMLHNKFGASQQFLFPQTLELSAGDFALVMEMEEEIKALGFVFSVFGKTTLVVNGVPTDVAGGNEKDLFEGLLEQFKQNKDELKLDRTENLARALARRSAIRPGTKLSITEMSTLIDQLFACKVPNVAPNGNLTLILMEMDKIAKFFTR